MTRGAGPTAGPGQAVAGASAARAGVPHGQDHDEPGSAAASSTRERILDVALDLFVDQGYDATSLRQIAERLGVTKQTVHRKHGKRTGRRL